MRVDRRFIVQSALSAGVMLAVPGRSFAGASGFTPQPGTWRTFETKIKLEIAKRDGRLQAWVPLPSVAADGWMRPGSSSWTAEGAEAKIVDDHGTKLLHLVWPDRTASAIAEVKSRFSTQDRAVEFGAIQNKAALTGAERAHFTRPTDLITLDGVVKETADKITAGAKSDLDKARRIYDWVVDNTFRNPKTRGCGLGDISSMLKTGDLSGKCADLNALFVGLARASGLPARDVYGLRLISSKFGYKSLGPSTDIVTKAQHCRAEVFVSDHGWIPADPADVRKVALEEPPGNLALDNVKVQAARKTLFGAWEGNWLAYNFAHDVSLPGSNGPKLPFLMYPQVEAGDERLDPLDPDSIRYVISAREIDI